MLRHPKIFARPLRLFFAIAALVPIALNAAVPFVLTACSNECEALTAEIDACPEYKGTTSTTATQPGSCVGRDRARAACFLDNVTDICAVEFNQAKASAADIAAANQCIEDSLK